MRSAVEHFGALDVLVVNHGIWLGDDVDVDAMTDEQWHSTVATNLDSTFALIKHVGGADEAAGARREYRAHQLNRRTAWRSGPLRLCRH